LIYVFITLGLRDIWLAIGEGYERNLLCIVVVAENKYKTILIKSRIMTEVQIKYSGIWNI